MSNEVQQPVPKKKKQNNGRRRKIPVVLWLLPEVFQRVVLMETQFGLESPEGVFRAAFRLLEWWAKFYRPGCRIQFFYPDDLKNPNSGKSIEVEDPILGLKEH